MLSPDFLKARILEALPGAYVLVRDTTGGGDHFEAFVATPAFAGKGMVQQHQAVYAPLRPWLQTGELHALQLRTTSSIPETPPWQP
jgi:acid stress-induced BolA-like protein IbaG/YrbA